ncbi:MAG: Uma2 family endonuclease [Moorea sp. SIO1F2]|uniref:Uma2 family endonuclease n=1 Tax=unclassified Moorena TaxID=2683338 RepID=UPI0013B8E999|nr:MULTISPECIES: Uma2 family endonuclease [unclassified Moorena]NEN97242.1 Uma2 family endonuclease [Moorena sp. SIO3I7]NEO45366.1 Uma2 family endonuclease [Moorena sp. SIO4A3]NEO60553.1 Uma2 family endonuclease [Moorena sp. SIO4G2]NEO06619.1 Uma2 family endonuclease [Moorena sp. SIO3I8]NEO16586.1 Uma2 family endonuclease [Moorena sp. SIO3E8]
MASTFSSDEDSPVKTTQRIVLQNVSWQTYKALLADLGDHRASRLAYAQGMLEITMPSDRHETYKQLLERMVNTLTEELNLRVKGFASTTLNREDLEHGAEPDSCYYIGNVDYIQGRTVDLANDPPPDLVIEVDITSSSSRRFGIYKQIGVPEVWRYIGQTVEIYRLQNGDYVRCQDNFTFEILSVEIINQFLQQAETQDDTTMILAWRKWVRENLPED